VTNDIAPEALVDVHEGWDFHDRLELCPIFRTLDRGSVADASAHDMFTDHDTKLRRQREHSLDQVLMTGHDGGFNRGVEKAKRSSEAVEVGSP